MKLRREWRWRWSRANDRRDQGSMTIAMLAVLVVGLLLVMAAAQAGAVVVASARADVAADASALAAADQIALGRDRALAVHAARVTAGDNGARFLGWAWAGNFVTVRVEISVLGTAVQGRARAEVRPECRLGCGASSE